MVTDMMRLVMEAVMIIAIVCGMVFVMRVSAGENTADSLPPDSENNEDIP